ncbi:MAG: hypothetical protein H6741_12575 [Alphaproteobacteria bacterium]|nr:hypothetical protein [Alphaproteobacteria bacterium]MCB9793550.1 hypothetical protein [Alphaproteobacteria bacterium]
MLLTLALISPASAQECAPLDELLVALDAGQECESVLLGALRERAIETGSQDCLAGALAHRGLPVPGFVDPVVPEHPPLPEKLTRDPYGLYFSVESENFVVRWDDTSISEGNAREALENFEDGWRVEIAELGFPTPRYMDTYKLNIYVGESGPNAPALYASPAYQSRDSEGYPMIVMEAGLFSSGGKNTSVHEFNHATQDATVYSYTGTGAWYFEATASWVEAEVYPGDMEYATSVFGFAYLPYRSLDYFKLATQTPWEIESFHQYGALIWLRFLTENYVDPTFISQTWIEGDYRNNPMETTAELLDEQYGVDFDEVFFDFAGHNAVWDYQDRAAYLANIEARQSDYADQSLARSLTGPMLDWSSATTNLPERYGSNYILLNSLPGSDLHVGFEGDAVGSEGNEAVWNLQLVVPQGNRGAYTPIELVDGAADVWLDGFLDQYDDEVYLAISVISEVREPRETFGYRYFVETDATGGDDTGDVVEFIPNEGNPDEEESGRCASAPAEAWAGWFLAAGLVILRRRRRL